MSGGMHARALSTFRAKLRLADEGATLLRTGEVFEGDENLVLLLVRGRMAEQVRIAESKPQGTGKRNKQGRKRKKRK